MPRKRLDKPLGDGQVEELAALGLSDAEISSVLGRCEAWAKLHYRSAIRKGRARLRHSIRRAQIKSALSGNATMLIWLGKVFLGQSDRQSFEVNAEHKALSITPNVLERLRASYKLTMEQLRTRDALPTTSPIGEATHDARHGGAGVASHRVGAPGQDPQGSQGDRVGVSKTDCLSANSDSESVAKFDSGELGDCD